MKYNSQIHHRRSIRLKGYDYSQAGAYFITICCQKKECRFGKIVVGDIVSAYKSLVANGCWDIHKQKFVDVNLIPTIGKLWQRNYHEHIIRNERSYQNISKYIIDNPAKWNDDTFFM